MLTVIKVPGPPRTSGDTFSANGLHLRVFSDWAGEVKLRPRFSDRSLDHSLLSAVGAEPPHNGVMENKASQAVWRAAGEAEVLDSKRDRLALRPHGNDATHLFRRESVCISSCCLTGWYLGPAELAMVAPHPVHDDSKLAGNRDLGFRHAAPLGDVHAPCFEDHFLQRVSSVCAASYSKVRASSSRHRLTRPCRSVSPD